MHNPFDTIESAHQYMQLLDKVLEEVQATTEEDLQRIARADIQGMGRSADAIHLVSYKIEQLRHHVQAGSRVLNDLRTLRRLLMGERKPDYDVTAARRVS